MPKERPFLADHHTHAQDIEFHNECAAEAFGITVGDHLYPDVSIQRYIEHIVNNNLDTIWMIYEDEHRFNETKKAIGQVRPECRVKGFYFVRNPLELDFGETDRLHTHGLLQGIKLHPVIDNYPLVPEYVDRVMTVAMKYGIPVIFHSDDRRRSMHLTSPQNQLKLASTYPNVRLVIGHGGAYAHHRLVGENNTAAKSYWKTAKDLILAALNLTLVRENVIYESSVTTNRIKAALIAEFVEGNPSVATKIIAGNDFPIIGARLDSQIKALEKAGLSPRFLAQVAANRL